MNDLLHILLVEDTPDDATLIMLQLEQDGLEAEYQRVDSEAALTAALDPPPDLILSDYALPGFSGLRALQIVKERGLDIPFILISGTIGEDVAVNAMKQGADDYLMKDRLARLGPSIQNALNQKHLRKEKARADAALRQSEARYRDIFKTAPVSIWEEDFTEVHAALEELRAQGVTDFRTYLKDHPEFVERAIQMVKVLDVNETALHLYNVKDKTELLGNLVKFLSPGDFLEELTAFAEGKTYFERETIGYRSDRQPLNLWMTETFFTDDEGHFKALVCFNNITERKQAEEAIRNSREEYQALVNSIEGIVWEADANTFEFSFVSPQAERMLGYPVEKWIEEPTFWKDHIHPGDQSWAVDFCIDSTREMVPHQFEYRMIAADGSVIWLKDLVTVIVEDNRPVTLRGIMVDITERKRAEERFRLVVESSPNAILLTDEHGHIVMVNSQAEKYFGYERTEMIGVKIERLVPERHRGEHARLREQFLSDPQDRSMGEGCELYGLRKDGSEFPTEIGLTPLETQGGMFVMATIADITERKQSEEALRASEDFRRLIVDTEPECVKLVGPDGKLIEMNLAGLAMIEADSLSQVKDAPVVGIVAPDYRDAFSDLHKRVMSGESGMLEFEIIGLKGKRRWLETHAVPLRNSSGQIEALLGVTRDVTERKQAEALVQMQLKRLEALHRIDMAITSGLEMNLSLGLLLDQVISILNVDAAAVLLLEPHAHLLRYAAGRGFHSNAIQHTQLALGKGHAGRAALERRAVHIRDLESNMDELTRSASFASEKFKSYFAAPLIAKGQVRGVLEIYHRSFLEHDQDWVNFMEMMANQAAITIEDAQLFNELQRSNLELALAYDATIEGWSRALDLRDKETEGHTQRVTTMTLKLAQAVNVDLFHMVHMRRGALLHDIGKMGIPDAILLKNGKLTAEEWDIMRRHPIYAYEMLLPIEYLKPALDIPYRHHEKWDGSGYPHGLKGEEIPQAARIFAVADVWDALISDRPYRKAWSREDALEYIKSESGKHFDPNLVEHFLRLIQEQGDHAE